MADSLKQAIGTLVGVVCYTVVGVVCYTVPCVYSLTVLLFL